jgi:hypothetical protein
MSAEYQPSSIIKGRQDSFNVNSVLDQIDNIEKELHEKRRMNNEKRNFISKEESKREKMVGQILSRKDIPTPRPATVIIN